MQNRGYEKLIKHIFTIYHQNEIDVVELDSNKKTITLGRNSDNEIVINSYIISAYHAYFEVIEDKCVLYDNNSKNGIYVNGVKKKNCTLANGDVLKIDNESRPLKSSVTIIYSVGNEDYGENWMEYPVDTDKQVRIGRDSTNDIWLDHSAISRNHAVFFHKEDSFYIKDMDSTNGIFINGLKISSIQRVKTNDVLYIGDTKLIFNGKALLYNYYIKGFRVDAISLKKDVTVKKSLLKTQKKAILKDISIDINSGELVAVIGASGSGKTTLLKVLSGLSEPNEGTVLVNGDNLYENYEVYRNILGYVPQNDALYENLTIGEMLKYSAKLRISTLTKPEINNEIVEVLKDVQLEGKENSLIRDLSGGEKKRVSIAVELLGRPKLLYLDEPTSGLDPETESNINMLLRKLSYDGKTVIFTTHSTSCIDLCNKIAVVSPKGRLCFFGTPPQALNFFEVDDYYKIYSLISSNTDYWERKLVQSGYYRKQKPILSKRTRSSPKAFTSVGNLLKQFWVLTQRYIILSLRDKIRMLLLLLQAPIIAFLLGSISDGKTFRVHEEASSIILIIACSLVWIGLLNSFQEVSKETGVYYRERNTNLNNTAYVFSKVIVLSILSLIQSILFVGTLLRVMAIPKYSLIGSIKVEMLLTVFLTGFVASLCGLFISAAVRNNDQAVGVVPVVMVFQIIFSGMLFKTKYVIKLFSNGAISRWASSALGTTVNINNIPYKSPLMLKNEDMFFVYSWENLVKSWNTLLLYGVFFVMSTIFVLNKKRNRSKSR